MKFNSADQNEHGALLALGNILYIPFVGQYGDGGNYLAGDLDFGASTPAFVPAGVSTPSLLVAPAEGERLYVLDGANLSGGTYPTPGATETSSPSSTVTLAQRSSPPPARPATACPA